MVWTQAHVPGCFFLFFPPLEWLSGRIPLGKLGRGRSTTGGSVLGSRRTREGSSGLEGSSDWLKEMPCCLCRRGKQRRGPGGTHTSGTWVHLHSRRRRDHFIARWDPFDASLHVMGKRLPERSPRAPEQRRICTSSDGRLSWEIIAPRQFCEFPPTQMCPLLQRYCLFYLKSGNFLRGYSRFDSLKVNNAIIEWTWWYVTNFPLLHYRSAAARVRAT